MTGGSVDRGAACGMGRGMDRSMDKRKVCVFLILVAVGLLCLCVMAYTLFYARPRGNPTITNGGGQSSLRLDARTSVHS
jgi:hypothetical protein